jgi:hypothetical protein
VEGSAQVQPLIRNCNIRYVPNWSAKHVYDAWLLGDKRQRDA